ncbi:MAG TPA: serine hydrolase domain-containing protein, partial [Propionibacteriaceae bacterium]|nr:serine hydrolase domain-containing protein [Propionibacteriaceae bacterium]
MAHNKGGGDRSVAARRRRGLVVGVVLLVALALGLAGLWVRLAPRTAVPPGQSRPATHAELDRFLARESNDLGLPGIAVTVLKEGVPDYRGFVGRTASGRAVDGSTPFVLGSTSKQLTGLAVQRLVSDGRLSLDALVGGILPGFTGGDKGQVRVQDLLAQTSGFSTTSGVRQWGWRPDSPRSIQDAAAQLATEGLDRAPGGSFEYSNANYDVLGAVVEKVSGRPYADALQDLVLGPLALTHTTAAPGAAGEPEGFSTWFGLVTVPTPAPATPGGVPSAFVTSTADDLAALVQAHLGTRPSSLPPAVLDASRRPLVRVSEYAQYASGWFVRPLWEEHPLD